MSIFRGILKKFGKTEVAESRRRIEGVRWHVQDFCLIRDVLFVRGRIQVRNSESPRISLRFIDGSVVSPPVHHDKVPDCEPDLWAFAFHQALERGTAAAVVQQTCIVFSYSDGDFELSNPTSEGIARDAFLNSEDAYWALVRANAHARIIEIGSRARSGIDRRGLFPQTAEYTGLDIKPGENVTVVGDAHDMSTFLPNDYFDFAFSVSVWEHLAMPWKVSIELNRILKLGGHAMINSHQAWPMHEEPWDYFRFSDFAWDALFNEATGFKIVGRGMGQPCIMGASLLRSPLPAEGLEWHYGYLSARVIVKKIANTQLAWPVGLEMVSKSTYSH